MYVYAVCRPYEAALQAELTGVGQAPVKALRHGDLVAVLSAVPQRDFAEQPLRAHLEDLDWLAATARAHQTVVAALATVTSPVPLRLATVFHDESGVRTLIEAEADRFRRTLDRLDGRVEWGVKVQLQSGSSQPEAPARPAPASGRDYLRQRLAGRRSQDDRDERAERFAARLHQELSRHAEAARLHPPQNSSLSREPGRNVLNAAYLVPRKDSEAFVELVDRTKGEESDLGVELTGPWAAYSFTEFAEDAEDAEDEAEEERP
ncbi:GvpL/GvpF family gas vesicle protein [Streptomyces sp. NBC_01304]|uniref:GvpL/GvpF family gas vesicle protein n=1 Tax=Streptomyces sp. NBC_01304 TaxID=2903818 RepID=UPI003FA3661B